MTFQKGYTPWNKDKKTGLVTETVFKKGHSGYWLDKKRSDETKRKMGESRKGPKNYMWKGGKYKHGDGYIMILKREHPFCSDGNYILEHRLVVEQQIGRYLKSEEMTHHLNSIKDDNRPQNLIAFINRAAHVKFEAGHSVKPSEIIFDGRKLHN